MRALAAIALLGLAEAAAQTPPPRLIVQLPGTCVGALRLGPRELPCAPPGATYAVLEDGRAFVLMPFGPSSGINFVGSRDSQPTERSSVSSSTAWPAASAVTSYSWSPRVSTAAPVLPSRAGTAAPASQ